MKCKSDKPYPKARVEHPNKKYAKLLLEDYASSQSEDTAIHLYLYQSLILNSQYEELAKYLKEIAQVEMHHLFLLGETIKLLGLSPIFGCLNHDNYLIPWSSSAVDYTTDLQEMLEVDIKRETDAIHEYSKHKKMIDDIYIKELIDRIIEDERIHLAIFHFYYQKLFCSKLKDVI